MSILGHNAGSIFTHMPDNAPKNYQMGWKDGCESGMTIVTNSFYHSFYAFKIQENLVEDEIYYKAWKDAAEYCRGYAYGQVKEVDVRRPLPSKHGINEIMDMGQGVGALNFIDKLGPSSIIRW